MCKKYCVRTGANIYFYSTVALGLKSSKPVYYLAATRRLQKSFGPFEVYKKIPLALYSFWVI